MSPADPTATVMARRLTAVDPALAEAFAVEAGLVETARCLECCLVLPVGELLVDADGALVCTDCTLRDDPDYGQPDTYQEMMGWR